ncbi:Protein transport protein sft2 [Schizosaccharomyces pombe]|uniref:Protein transport protein sft2 n=1 Tax=Schizosaccharomyces pombe (strain 972 / ATCC 24843) TaxID=284812 RepID=SFT2_SCHPO|nr:putative transport protein Sft2 [Schizosaccharomyces pombe]Q9P6K1.1 RecName: Full=Protein transport protein sft2 [Schizosaccharomyces pombe 972h-]CAB90797.1 Golgi transport protein Sft2 (predicted) [Schizosaccharomyces pombe]|eukprot:NP_594553.1 putative transport protein Sft2 [Schizosaccharomyces pombe]
MEGSFQSRLQSIIQRTGETTAESTNSWYNRLRTSMPWSNDYTEIPTNASGGNSYFQSSEFSLSRWERYMLFGICLLGSLACYAIACFMFPVLVLKPRKFVLLWTMGSLLAVLGFAIVQGFVAHFRQLTTMERLPITLSYFVTLLATIIATIKIKSTILSIVFGVLHILSFVAYLIAFFPFGTRTVSLGTRMASRSLSNWLP